jgi:threonine synthase
MDPFENLTADRPTFVTHLECSATGERYEADRLHGLSDAGKPLLVRYDLDAISAAIDKQTLAARPPDMWRYREFLPVRDAEHIVSLGESMTPLIHLPSEEARLGTPSIVVKDESRLPTASFKARGLGMGVTMAHELGVKRVAMPTNGNAGAALAAYGSRVGMEVYVFCPADTPEVNVREIAMLGARVWRVNGLINDCGKIVGAGKDEMGWFDFSTLKEPYRIEGKKTMGLELAEQMSWDLPDVIFYPTGGGTGIIGMWKAFNELEAMGWITRKPRLVAVQSEGCAPIVKAYQEGKDHAELWKDAATVAAGIRVPAAIGDFLILEAVRNSGGFAIAVSESAIERAQATAAARDGVMTSPEGAATLAGLEQALEEGLVDRNERMLLFNCGHGLKYPMPPSDQALDHTAPIDFAALAATAHPLDL